MKWLNRDVTTYPETPVHWLDKASIAIAAEAKRDKERSKPQSK